MSTVQYKSLELFARHGNKPSFDIVVFSRSDEIRVFAREPIDFICRLYIMYYACLSEKKIMFH